MRIERISENQFTIFLTFEDLIERGFTKEDLWQDATKVHHLFSDMMYEASSELGFELEGALLVQVHLLQAQGMHIVVTQQTEEPFTDDEYIEMEVTLDESNELMFLFKQFDHIIDVASYLKPLGIDEGKVYYFNDHYYLLFKDDDLNHVHKEDVISILSEFAQPSIITSHRLEAYGKEIFKQQAIKQIYHYFL